MNMRQILNGYGTMDISCRSFDPNAGAGNVLFKRKPAHYRCRKMQNAVRLYVCRLRLILLNVTLNVLFVFSNGEY
jgi:hypothetical protein